MPTCEHCGSYCHLSENKRFNSKTGKYESFLINPGEGSPHICAEAKIAETRRKDGNNKYENTIKITAPDGKTYNAMWCKYRCGVRVFRDNSWAKEPKLTEVRTWRYHNYQRCYNLHVDKGLPIPHEMQNMIYGTFIEDYPYEDQLSFLKAMPPNSIWMNYIPGFQANDRGSSALDPEHQYVFNLQYIEKRRAIELEDLRPK